MYDTFVCKGEDSDQGDGANVPYGSYQILGNILIDYSYPQNFYPVTDYKRELSLQNAVSEVSFRKGTVHYKREYFTSFKEDVGVIRLTTDRENTIHFTIGLNRPERYEVRVEGEDLVMSGTLNDGYGGDGTLYEARVRIKLPKGGNMQTGDSLLSVENASEVIIFIAAGTDYFEERYDRQLNTLLKVAQEKDYITLKEEHSRLYGELFNRVELNLQKTGKEKLPIKKTIERLSTRAK